MPENSDEQLITRYLRGDEKSLEVLIKRYLKPIYSFVCRYIGNSSEAEDVTQEVFVKVWRNLRKFNRQKSFKTWIFTIVKNTCIDAIKKKKAIPFSKFENEKGENPFLETLADPGLLPNEVFEQVDIGKILNAAIKQLVPQHRMVLFLRYNDHFNFREIAEVLGEPLNTIKSRHRRALIFLKKLLLEF